MIHAHPKTVVIDTQNLGVVESRQSTFGQSEISSPLAVSFEHACLQRPTGNTADAPLVRALAPASIEAIAEIDAILAGISIASFSV